MPYLKSCLQVADGDFSTHEQSGETGTEIDILVKSFNDMVQALAQSQQDALQKSIIESKFQEEQIASAAMRTALVEAELKFLHMQINPHFLFNTFNTISALCQIEEAYITCDMIEKLSNILRYAMKGLDHKATLREEIDVTTDYLNIQKMRFQNRLQFSIDIQEQLLTAQVPTMVLQPLVENAITHGLDPKENGGTVSISAISDTEILYLVVEDDGVGFNQKTVEIQEFPQKGHGIGVKNVERRLTMLYGEGTFSIDSVPSKGTKVTLKLPLAHHLIPSQLR